MDDLDAYFGDDAVDAFVDGFKIDGDGEKHEIIEMLLKDDGLILSALASNEKKPEETKKVGKVMIKRKEVNPS